nr:hypothetical protein PanWU01x14_048850 [Ipomoea batatas]
MEDENPDSGADDVDRRIRTRMWPLTSISDSVQSGPRPSRDMTSLSTANFVMEAAISPGNWFLINDALKDKKLNHEGLGELSIHGLKQRDTHNKGVGQSGEVVLRYEVEGQHRHGENGDEAVDSGALLRREYPPPPH